MTAIRIGTIALLIAAFFWLAGYFVGDYFYSKSDEPEQDKWCQAGEINERGELTYSQNYAGETEFVVLAIAAGPVLMSKCK